MKREKARQRALTRFVKPICLKIEADLESESQDAPTGEVKNKKKVLQMIRNRISAQTSRDRKKHYLYQLEDSKSKLYSENSMLKHQNTSLLQEIAKLKAANQRMIQQNEGLRNGSGLEIIDIDPVEEKPKLNQHVIETIVRKVMNNNTGILSQGKESLTDVCSFASALSSMVFGQNDSQNSKLESR